MRGLTVQGGVEVRIEVTGESWHQGSLVHATVNSKNGAPVRLSLVVGIEKKIKSRAPDAFVRIEQKTSATLPLQHTFALPPDARITDKSGSLYLLYGLEQSDHPAPLRLQVEPHPHLTDLARIIVTEFRFSLKMTSAGKGNSVDFKLEPPKAKEWASLESLVLNCRISSGTLDAHFTFQRKEIDVSSSTLRTKVTQGTIKRSLNLGKLVHDFNQKLNTDLCQEILSSVFTEYKNHSWLPA